ncbi:hypothetical protein HB435_002736 [Salmonella enterica subsp. enterica serovar Stanley]|nr:hypothetical protein [Salmonella enterica subsp. enterica serovar Stanley]
MRTVAFNRLNRQTMEESWSGTVAFNPLNRQTMEESWPGTEAFNPLNRQTTEGLLPGTRPFNHLLVCTRWDAARVARNCSPIHQFFAKQLLRKASLKGFPAKTFIVSQQLFALPFSVIKYKKKAEVTHESKRAYRPA